MFLDDALQCGWRPGTSVKNVTPTLSGITVKNSYIRDSITMVTVSRTAVYDFTSAQAFLHLFNLFYLLSYTHLIYGSIFAIHHPIHAKNCYLYFYTDFVTVGLASDV